MIFLNNANGLDSIQSTSLHTEVAHTQTQKHTSTHKTRRFKIEFYELRTNFTLKMKQLRRPHM